MSKKSLKRFSHLPGATPHPTGAGSASDRFETASTDSFPASDAPGWTAVTGVGTPRTIGGPWHNEEQS
jgi:hypothetical protein